MLQTVEINTQVLPRLKPAGLLVGSSSMTTIVFVMTGVLLLAIAIAFLFPLFEERKPKDRKFSGLYANGKDKNGWL